MNNFPGKTPFFRLLIPIVVAIIICSYVAIGRSAVIVAVITGLTAMLYSFFIKKEKQYCLRWVFGAGLSLILFSFTVLSFNRSERYSEYDFDDAERSYLGIVTDIPEAKRATIACNLKLTYPENKKVLVYIEKSDHAWMLEPGDEIAFNTRINPFKNFDTPNDFDYKRHMKIKGFAGTAYIADGNWKATGRVSKSIPVLSQRFRKSALSLYESFGLDIDSFAFISALTLGYKSDLSDNIQEAFRASGTSHVLAVSGLHVGIIYIVINLLFSFLGGQGAAYSIRQLLIILVLWWYVFVAGMSASIVRAAIMLTINCVGKILGQKGFTYNTLAAAAFFILIFNPYSLFDISFQMSFGAVFAILFFQPEIDKIYTPKRKLSKELWNMSTVSFSAQLGVFPLVLYYFGTFPVYFFITNLLVVPLVGFVIYSGVPLIIASLLTPLSPVIFSFIQPVFQWITKTLIGITLRIVYIAESLPFAQITDQYINLIQLALILIFIYVTFNWLTSQRRQALIVSLTSLLLFSLTITLERIPILF